MRGGIRPCTVDGRARVSGCEVVGFGWTLAQLTANGSPRMGSRFC